MIHEEWIVYSNKILPKEAPSYQRRDMEMSFYAGVGSALKIIDAISKIPNEEEGVKKIKDLWQELQIYAENFYEKHNGNNPNREKS